MIAVALTPNLKIAAVCTSYMVSLFHLFAGFVMTQPDMPGWWYVHLPLPLLCQPFTHVHLLHCQVYPRLVILLATQTLHAAWLWIRSLTHIRMCGYTINTLLICW